MTRAAAPARWRAAARLRLALLLVPYLALLGAEAAYVPVNFAGSGPLAAAWLGMPLLELALVGILVGLLAGWQARTLARTRLALALLVAGGLGLVWLVQLQALRVSGNFLTVLALENRDSLRFVLRLPLLVGGAALLLAWVGVHAALLRREWRAAPRAVSRRRLWLFIVLGGVWTAALALRPVDGPLRPSALHPPLAAMAKVLASHSLPAVGRLTLHSAWLRRDAAAGAAGVTPGQTSACFPWPARLVNARYPFLRARAYAEPLPWPRRAAAPQRPNLIVIFTEGLSARLLGAYGGARADLTPNIDALAADALQVENYYNHTAATYRGLQGQLTSGFPFRGGAGEHGWAEGGDVDALAGVRRRSVADILRARGWDTHFFSVHPEDSPFTRMLRGLGFEQIHAAERIGEDLLGGAYGTATGPSLDDRSLFAGLVAFLRQRETAADAAPFFIAAYNIGTHAFLDVPEGGVRWGDGRNVALNSTHNLDHAFGRFLAYFRASPHARDTILVFTSDHAKYPEPPYLEAVGLDVKPYFVDRIPLLIADPVHALPRRLDAGGRNSLALAPTLLQLLGVGDAEQSFLGRSLFEARSFPVGIAALGAQFFLSTPEAVYAADEIPPELARDFACESEVVRAYYRVERDNRLVPAAH